MEKPVSSLFSGRPWTKDELRAKLPKVGDRLMKIPELRTSVSLGKSDPLLCTVVHVNQKRFWYTVQFEKGYQQTYKLPEKGVNYE